MSSQSLGPLSIGRGAALFFASLFLTACTGSGEVLSSAAKLTPVKSAKAHINTTTKFSQAAYGVAASPRLTTSRKVRKGGGRRQVGKPYKIKGKWYRPKEEPGYDRKGNASWYGPNFHGRLTANGEVYDQYALSGAHPTFPLPSYARVTNRKNGRSVIVRVNDRGPYHDGRIIDLSAKAAEMLDYQKDGVAKVRVQYIGPAPLHGLDHTYLVSSYKGHPGRPDSKPEAPASVLMAKSASTSTPSVKALRPPARISAANAVDDVVTGSVKPAALKDDFFVAQLKAARAYGVTNSTIGHRLKSRNLP